MEGGVERPGKQVRREKRYEILFTVGMDHNNNVANNLNSLLQRTNYSLLFRPSAHTVSNSYIHPPARVHIVSHTPLSPTFGSP